VVWLPSCAVEKELEEAGADMFTQALSADIADQLEAGHEVAYSALSSQEGYAVSRVAGGEDQVEGSSLVVDESGAYGSRFLATADGNRWRKRSLRCHGRH